MGIPDAPGSGHVCHDPNSRPSLAQKGLENALAGILPTLVDARPGGTSVVLDTLRAVADAAEAVLMWAEQEIITQEEIAITEVPGP